MKLWRSAAGICLLATGCAAVATSGRADSLVVVDNPVLIVESKANTATGWLQLRNNSTERLWITLSATDFQSTTTSNTFGGRLSFAIGNKWEPWLETDGIAVRSNLAIQIEATNVWEAGVSEAQLLTNGLPFALIRAVRWDVPFAVSVVGTPAERPELVYDCSHTVSLVLSNADAMSYRVRWDFAVGGQTVTGGIAVLPPSSQVKLAGIPDRGIFCGGPSAWVKDRVRDAQLSLRWEPPAMPVVPLSREKLIPIRLRLPSNTAAQYVMVSFFLVLGVIGSWLLHITLPNLQRRAELGSQLDLLSERIRNLSNHIDSSLRIILRVQRRRLIETLKGGFVSSPAQSNDFDAVKASIATLSSQMSIVERMDRVYDQIVGLDDAACPLSVLEMVDQGLTRASRLLRAARPTDEDLASAESQVKEAEDRLGRLGKLDDALAVQIAERIKQVRAYLTEDVIQGDDGARVFARLGSLLKPRFEQTDEDSRTVTPDKYREFDVKSWKLELVVRYLQVLGNSTEETE